MGIACTKSRDARVTNTSRNSSANANRHELERNFVIIYPNSEPIATLTNTIRLHSHIHFGEFKPLDSTEMQGSGIFKLPHYVSHVN